MTNSYAQNNYHYIFYIYLKVEFVDIIHLYILAIEFVCNYESATLVINNCMTESAAL